MAKLNNAIAFETTFGTYVVDELIGEGGAGRVYGGIAADGTPIAVKLLKADRATTERRSRFKNEIAFLARNTHANIVCVTDHGIAHDNRASGPFYVMRRFDGNLRGLMHTGISPNGVLPVFLQILDGVEAAHLQGVVHRDLKPENILCERMSNTLAIADFGIASFTEDIVVTLVETDPAERLANFLYAAPEQRSAGQSVTTRADIYSLGLILNEMFTGIVPHGTGYRTIGQVAKDSGYLDDIVAKMLRQAPAERPGSIADIKGLLQRYQAEAISLQRLSTIRETVIQATEIDEPLAEVPPSLTSIDWQNGQLTLTLDRPVTKEWVNALHHMTSYSSVMGKPPASFNFRGNHALVGAHEHQVQQIVDHFKSWLPTASRTLKALLQQAAAREEAQRSEAVRREREAEEQRLRVLRNTRL